MPRSCVRPPARVSFNVSHMNADLNELLSEAKSWLEAQQLAEEGSPKWYALGNFQRFVEQITADGSWQSVERAEWELNRFVSDQFEWSADYCKAISSFKERAHRIGRKLKNG